MFGWPVEETKEEKERKKQREKAMAEIMEAWSLVEKSFDWQDDAACATTGENEWFFPEGPGNPTVKFNKAKEVCSSCNVVSECLNFAVSNKFDYGVWGGLTPEERREINWETYQQDI